jgi:hypothetical protein
MQTRCTSIAVEPWCTEPSLAGAPTRLSSTAWAGMLPILYHSAAQYCCPSHVCIVAWVQCSYNVYRRWEASRRHQLQSSSQQLVGTLKLRMLYAAVCPWRSSAAHSAQQQQLLQVGQRKLRRAMLGHVFAAWAAELQRAHEHAAMVSMALARRARQACVAALQSWQHAVAHARHRAQAADALRLHWRKRILANVLQSWAHETARARSVHAKAARASALIAKLRTMAVFLQWRQLGEAQTQRCLAAEALLERHQARMLAHSFALWHRAALDAQDTERMTAAGAHLHGVLFGRAMGAWRARVVASREAWAAAEDLLKRRQYSDLMAALRSWRHVARQQQGVLRAADRCASSASASEDLKSAAMC